MRLENSDVKVCQSLFLQLDRFALLTVESISNDPKVMLNSNRPLTIESRACVRRAWQAQPAYIDDFIAAHMLTNEQVDILYSWKDRKSLDYIIVKCCPEYTIFMGMDGYLYGVLALFENFINLLPHNPPIWVNTCLYPYKDKIIYEGLLEIQTTKVNQTAHAETLKLYNDIQKAHGIITQL